MTLGLNQFILQNLMISIIFCKFSLYRSLINFISLNISLEISKLVLIIQTMSFLKLTVIALTVSFIKKNLVKKSG